MFRVLFPLLDELHIANIITSLSICFSLLAIFASFAGNLEGAVLLLFSSVICDGLDGTVARYFGRQSSFGNQLDGFADSIAFCLVPAVIGYNFGLSSPTEICFLMLFTISGVWRIAQYNVIPSKDAQGETVYSGLITTSAASLFVFVWGLEMFLEPTVHYIISVSFFFVTPFLMVSSLKNKKYGPVNYICHGAGLLTVCVALILRYAT